MRAAAIALLLAIAACAAAPTSKTSTTLEPRPLLPGATAELGVVYAPASRSQTLDLFRPRKGHVPHPLVVRLNGSTQGASAAAITDAGFALALVRHRPPSEAPLVSAARDVKAAVRYLRANAARYDLDPTRFIAWGSGDAGWLAMMLGVTGDQATGFDDPALGNAGTSSAVAIVIDWGGPTDFASLDADQATHPSPACIQTYQRHALPGTAMSQWVCGDSVIALDDPACAAAVREADLSRYVPTAKKLPAFYFAHGADDCVVSIWQPVRLLEALKKRELEPGYHRMSRAGRDDPRFEAEETSRSLAFIEETFHPEAGAHRTGAILPVSPTFP